MWIFLGNGVTSVQLNGEREGSPHQQNEARDTSFSRKEKKEILVGVKASGCSFNNVLTVYCTFIAYFLE